MTSQLENLVQGRLRKALLAVTDTVPLPARLEHALDLHEPPGARALLDLVADDDPASHDAAFATVLRDLRDRLLADTDEILTAIARYQLDGLAWAPAATHEAGVARAL